jgi:hypothetical protein
MLSRRSFLTKSLGLTGIASMASVGFMAGASPSDKTTDDNLAPAQITILASDPATGILTMSDHGNSKANRGDVITWVVGPKSGVSSILAIDKKDVAGNNNIFSKGPAQLGSSSNWQGTINPNLPAGITQEIYFIKWADNSGASHTYDPVIQVNP